MNIKEYDVEYRKSTVGMSRLSNKVSITEELAKWLAIAHATQLKIGGFHNNDNASMILLLTGQYRKHKKDKLLVKCQDRNEICS